MERSLESTWVLEVGPGPIWKALSNIGHWPAWWPAIIGVELLAAGNACGEGASFRVNGKLELRVCEVMEPHLLEFHTDRVLGRWTLSEEEGLSFVHLSVWGYEGGETAFAEVMSKGAHGLAGHLGVRLVEAGSWSAASENLLF